MILPNEPYVVWLSPCEQSISFNVGIGFCSRVSSVKQSVKILNPAILSVTRLYSVSYSVTKNWQGSDGRSSGLGSWRLLPRLPLGSTFHWVADLKVMSYNETMRVNKGLRQCLNHGLKHLSTAQKKYSATNAEPASHIYKPGRDLETAWPTTSVTTETLVFAEWCTRLTHRLCEYIAGSREHKL